MTCFLQAQVPQELFRVKDFASDKLVDDLCSYKTLKKLSDGMESGLAEGLIEDAGALAITLFFIKLHLHAVNALVVPARHRALYLFTLMLWFTSLSGVSATTK